MKHVYIDPSSHVYLDNVLFKKDTKYNRDNALSAWYYLKEYCLEKNISVQTIDFWNPATATNEDVYVSFDHKFFLRKIYWKMRNKNYPIVSAKKFKKSIVFHFEPPVVMPEIRYLVKGTVKMYDKVFFTWEINDAKAEYFHTPQAHEGIFLEYWENKNRGFTMIINSNRKTFFRYKELLTERVRAILSFSKTNDIDLYGVGWDKPPLFPYWFQKNKIKKVYKGSIEDKYKVLSKYTFAFAFENCELPGYITDKIFDCFYAGAIPIYLGAPNIAEYIPAHSFIHMRDFSNYESLRKFLKSLSEKKIAEYKENGRRFLESEQYRQFGKEHFAKIFVEACKSNA